MDDCIFCKIISGDIPASKVYENNDVVAFLSIGPINKGHTIVIPKKHYVNSLDCDNDIFLKVMSVVHKLAPFVKNATSATGINIGINNGADAGQDVFHLHVHIIPRYDSDSFEFWPNGSYSSNDEMEEYAKKIRGNLDV